MMVKAWLVMEKSRIALRAESKPKKAQELEVTFGHAIRKIRTTERE